MATLEGFVLAGLTIGTIVPGGLAWFAPQCSTWLSFMRAVHMQRSSHCKQTPTLPHPPPPPWPRAR
eukprot:9147881-Pyramimonas_sp.AAC.1